MKEAARTAAHVVRDYLIGNTRIRIADDYCIEQKEVGATLERIGTRAQRQLEAAARREDRK